MVARSSPSDPIVLGKYTLLEELGKGGFGTVYRAEDTIGRVVAVKILSPYWSNDSKVIQRFWQEARYGGRLFHQRIATILDYEEIEGYFVLIMRYVDGQSLGEILDTDGRLAPQTALKILGEVAEGIDYAHQNNLVHRDIKPTNILISPTEGAIISDFGLVKMTTGEATFSGSDVIGTPAYMSPEQYLSEKPDYRTDIYALGVVFFEMLTGIRPYTATTPGNMMMQHVSEPVPHVHTFRDDLPLAIQAVIEKAMAKKPEDRYQSAFEMYNEAAKVLAPASTLTTRPVLRRPPYEVLATSVTPALVVYLLDTSASMSLPLGDRRRVDIVLDAMNRSFTQMVFRSTKGMRVNPRYRVAVFGYDDEVRDLLGGVRTIDQLVKTGMPQVDLGIETDTASGFRAVEELLLHEVDASPNCPAPVVCHMTDGMFTGEDPEPVVRRILQLKVPDGNVLISNIFIANEIEQLAIGKPDQWTGILDDTPLPHEGYLDRLRRMSSRVPASYAETMKEFGYAIPKDARMLFPADQPEMVVMGFQMSAATPVRKV